MITEVEAQQIAEAYLNEVCQGSKEPLAILTDKTLTKEYGWIFHWNSQRYSETRDIRQMLFGPQPIVVEKTNGRVTRLYAPVEEALGAFEQSLLDGSLADDYDHKG